MYSRQLEQIARQRTTELTTKRPQLRAAQPAATRSIRSNTGWAIVAIGLRIAEPGSR